MLKLRFCVIFRANGSFLKNLKKLFDNLTTDLHRLPSENTGSTRVPNLNNSKKNKKTVLWPINSAEVTKNANYTI